MNQYPASLPFAFALIPGLKKPKQDGKDEKNEPPFMDEFSFSVTPRVRTERDSRKPDVLTKETFDDFAIPVKGDALQYGTQLVIECRGSHRVDPDIAATYPGLERSLKWNYDEIADGEIAFYDASNPGLPQRDRGFTVRIWMNELFDRCNEDPPQVRRLGKGDNSKVMMAGVVETRTTGEGNKSSSEKMGFIIISQLKRCAVYLSMADVAVVFEAYLRLHALDSFHALMKDFGAVVTETPTEDLSEHASETDEEAPPVTTAEADTPRPRRGSKKNAVASKDKSKRSARSKRGQNDDDAGSSATGKPVASPTTSLGPKLADAGFSATPPATTAEA